MAQFSETTVRVRYAETDQMGVVYHGNYFVWFEVGRVEFMRELGFDYRTLEREEGCYLLVAEATCRYKGPARYDDLLRIRTELKGVRGPVVRFAYTVMKDDDGAVLAEGETAHLVADTQMKVRSLPDRYARALQSAMASGDGQ